MSVSQQTQYIAAEKLVNHKFTYNGNGVCVQDRDRER